MHEALRALPRGLAFKAVSLALTFLTLIQFPLTSMASHTEVSEDTITDPNYFYYQHGDHLGSSHILTEGKSESRHSGIVYKKGNLLQRFEYAPFGQESFALNPNLKFDPSYTGQTYDIETGLYYYKSRYYDPRLARFIQPDTIIPDAKNLQSYNRYSYVSNNPLKYTDPSGHSAMDWFKRIFGAVIGVLIGLAATVITLGGLGVAGATFGAMFANATLGQLVAAGAVAGAIAGSVTGAITGGHMGALMGAAFGAAGGALGPLGNHALRGLSAGVRMAIFGAAGASLSYATGGWKGLATFGAAFATGAAIYGISKLSKGSGSKPLSANDGRESSRLASNRQGGDSEIASDVNALPHEQVAMIEARAMMRATNATQAAVNLTPQGYMDINVTVPGITVGTAFDSAGRAYGYIGVAIASPGVSVTGSPNSISTGWNFGAQAGYWAGGQVGYGGGSMFWEAGLVTPGGAGSAYYVWRLPNSTTNWQWP